MESFWNLEHEAGDCAGTNIDEENKLAWWKISLPDLADIYKINLMFRQGCKFVIQKNNTKIQV